MTEFYREMEIIEGGRRYINVNAEHAVLRRWFCSMEIQHLGVNVKMIYSVYQDPSRAGLVVEVNS